MTTITLPPEIGELPEMECQPGARQVLTDFRACAQALDDVVDRLGPASVPDGWQGDSQQAAVHAMTAYSRRADAATAAFERANLGLDSYLDAMDRLRAEWTALADRRARFNNDVRELLARIDGASESQVPALEAAASALQQRYDAFGHAWTAWQRQVHEAETELVRVFRSVDEVPEGNAARDAADRPDTGALLRALHRLGGDPTAVTAWWRALTPQQREALLDSDPDVVGNTNGIPTGDRDEANRGSITDDYAYLTSLEHPSAAQQRQLDHITSTLDAIRLGETRVPPVDTNLIVYQPHAFHGDGAAAVAYGDPDTADNTAILVPGLTSDMGSMAGLGHDALDVYDQANLHGQHTAVIGWMGYDAPNFAPQDALGIPGETGDVLGVGGEEKAEQGGHLLSGFVDGLRSTHDPHVPQHLTVIGHSYGSTTAAHAAADGMHADDLVLVGSPGAGGGVHDVSGLHLGSGHVFVGSRDNDFVTWLGGEIPVDLPFGTHHVHLGNLGLGDDPSQASFGATNFDVTGGYSDPQGTHYVDNLHNDPFHADQVGSVGVHNHNSYYAPGSDSLTNIAHIVDGERPQDIGGLGGGPRHEPAHDHLYGWAAGEAAYQTQQHVVDPIVEHVVEPVVHGAGVLVHTWQSFEHAWPGLP